VVLPHAALFDVPLDVPLDPDAPTAQQWLIDELSKSEYQQARPTWFDTLTDQIANWFQSLSFGGIQGPPAFGLLAIVVLVGIALVLAFLVFGLPRINRRSRVTGALFGEEDERSSVQLRAAAEAAAKRGEFEQAIADMFRSIARGLAERSVLTTSPGTTAHDFGERSGTAFPTLSAELRAAAVSFDDVRYLSKVGTRAQFDELARLEKRVRATKPVFDVAGVGAVRAGAPQ
jgi:hypothetical protein